MARFIRISSFYQALSNEFPLGDLASQGNVKAACSSAGFHDGVPSANQQTGKVFLVLFVS